jgi:hypothetical protein
VGILGEQTGRFPRTAEEPSGSAPFVSKNMTVLSIAAISYPVLILILGVKTLLFSRSAAMLLSFWRQK